MENLMQGFHINKVSDAARALGAAAHRAGMDSDPLKYADLMHMLHVMDVTKPGDPIFTAAVNGFQQGYLSEQMKAVAA